MAGIDKITKEIELEAEKEAASIVSAAEAAAQDARNKADQQRQAYISAADEKLNRKLAEENKKTQSQCEQAEKLILLETKQFLIDDILRKAKVKLLIQGKEDYFDTLLKILEKSVQAEKGELMLSKKDLERVPSDFESKANVVATKKGGTVELSGNTVDIEGGFILKYGNIEINSSFDAIFDENRDELMDIVNGILW